MKRKIIAIFTMVLTLSIAFIACGLKKSTNTPSSETNPKSTTTLGTEINVDTEESQDYLDKIVFLGDSTTYGLTYYDKIPSERVWTPSNGTLTLCYWDTCTIVYEDGSELSIVDALKKNSLKY